MKDRYIHFDMIAIKTNQIKISHFTYQNQSSDAVLSM